VVGGSEASGAAHTFLWTSAAAMQDLGSVDADLGSLPGSGMGAINNNGQVVGMSCVNDALCNTSNPELMTRAYLWQNGKMMDLNSLVVGGHPLYLLLAFQINDAGEIAGFGVTSTGDLHAFLATPIPGANAAENSSPGTRLTRPMALSEHARKLLQRRLPFGPSGARLIGPPR
jgi:probable HAF family extracellular repeat protein